MAGRKKDEQLESKQAQRDIKAAAGRQRAQAERLGRATRLQSHGRDDRANPNATRRDEVESRIIERGGRN